MTANALRVGDEFVTSDGRTATLERVVDDERYVSVYNLEVEADHTYFVGDAGWGFDLWSHNHDIKTFEGQQAWLAENNRPLTGGHSHGNTKPPKTSTPDSVYTHVNPRSGKAVQNAVYDADGKLIAHVDYGNHGVGSPSGHAHPMPVPGNPGSGHTHDYVPIQPAMVPPAWNTLPANVPPLVPIGS